MPRIDTLADDLVGEEEGKVYTWRGVDVRVRALRSKRVAAAMDRIGLSRKAGSGSWNERDEARFEEILARDVIVGWPAGDRGFQNADGDVPYTFESALNILRQPGFASFKAWLISMASDVDRFWRARESIEPEAAGN
jgi:hypothetical protein